MKTWSADAGMSFAEMMRGRENKAAEETKGSDKKTGKTKRRSIKFE